MDGLWDVHSSRSLIAGPRMICPSSASLLASFCVRAEPSHVSLWDDVFVTEQTIWATSLIREDEVQLFGGLKGFGTTLSGSTSTAMLKAITYGRRIHDVTRSGPPPLYWSALPQSADFLIERPGLPSPHLPQSTVIAKTSSRRDLQLC
ncbi:hypothetical protein D9613_012665 [Agrocybe pediades]|uniref:Uncharacterized protein n=1 Tax=Agrocybe pediades TaxID=84607 RepID=A0A8H4VRW9_9AGAR|nr:hypothetical protein D9613_012665 [Agrocybe pediades]